MAKPARLGVAFPYEFTWCNRGWTNPPLSPEPNDNRNRWLKIICRDVTISPCFNPLQANSEIFMEIVAQHCSINSLSGVMNVTISVGSIAASTLKFYCSRFSGLYCVELDQSDAKINGEAANSNAGDTIANTGGVKLERLEVRCLRLASKGLRSLFVGCPNVTGQLWLAGPDVNGLYLGMNKTGPVRLPRCDWEKFITSELAAASGQGTSQRRVSLEVIMRNIELNPRKSFELATIEMCL